MKIDPQTGLDFELDVSEDSTMIAPSVTPALSSLPVVPNSYGHFIAGPSHYTKRSGFHSMYQIFLTHSGCGRFLIDGKEFFAKPGTLCFLDCAVSHRYETYGELWDHEWVNFDGSACTAYHRLVNPDGFRMLPLTPRSEIPLLFRELAEHYGDQDTPGLVHTSTRLIRLMDAVYDHAVHLERSRIDDGRGNILLSIDYMHRNYRERITLDDLARIAYVSKFYYTRRFKSYTGMSPYEYLNSVRLSHVRSMLVTTSLTIDEIAWETGFINSGNLIRQFKRFTGITPGEYRRNPGH